jgi:hypothetical protein
MRPSAAKGVRAERALETDEERALREATRALEALGAPRSDSSLFEHATKLRDERLQLDACVAAVDEEAEAVRRALLDGTSAEGYDGVDPKAVMGQLMETRRRAEQDSARMLTLEQEVAHEARARAVASACALVRASTLAQLSAGRDDLAAAVARAIGSLEPLTDARLAAVAARAEGGVCSPSEQPLAALLADVARAAVARGRRAAAEDGPAGDAVVHQNALTITTSEPVAAFLRDQARAETPSEVRARHCEFSGRERAALAQLCKRNRLVRKTRGEYVFASTDLVAVWERVRHAPLCERLEG